MRFRVIGITGILQVLQVLVILVVLFNLPLAARAQTYSTSFQNEPVANWLEGKTTGGNWNNCVFSTGFAYGSQPMTVNYDDSLCVLSQSVFGAWSANQSASQKIVVSGKLGAQFDEAEVHLNTTITNGSITGYEINCSLVSGNPYMQIVRWDGSFGKYSELDGRSVGCGNGDVLSAARSGATITAYKNGSAIFNVTDSKYLNGMPGMGFYVQTLQSGTVAQADAAFGASEFCADDAGSLCSFTQTGPPPPPNPTVNLTWAPTTSTTSVFRAQSSSSTCSNITAWTILATVSGSSYSDSTVTLGDWYCYTVVPGSGGLTGAPSEVVSVQATSSSSAGSIESAPVIRQIQTVSGNVAN